MTMKSLIPCVQLPVWYRVGSEGKGSKSVHGDVDPQQLDSVQDGLLLSWSNGRYECDDGGDVGQDLELQELTNGIIDIG